jgi:hypothetical protein
MFVGNLRTFVLNISFLFSMSTGARKVTLSSFCANYMFRAVCTVCSSLNAPNTIQKHDFGFIAGRTQE